MRVCRYREYSLSLEQASVDESRRLMYECAQVVLVKEMVGTKRRDKPEQADSLSS